MQFLLSIGKQLIVEENYFEKKEDIVKMEVIPFLPMKGKQNSNGV